MSIAEISSTAINGLLLLLVLVCWLLLMIRFVKNKYAAVKTVQAMVVDKYKTQTVSNIQGTFKRESCIIVFLAGDEKLAFEVSEFSFQGYEMMEKGTLKYKGDKIIDFS